MSTPVSVQDVIDELVDVFPPEPLDPADAFGEYGGTYLDADAFKAGVRGRSWNALPSELLELHHDAVHFLGPASFADYLPAFVAAIVRRDQALDQLPRYLLTALTRSDEHAGVEDFDARVARLTPAQQRAVARALEALEASHELPRNKRTVAVALDSYWRKLVDRS
jgi:hypothetical protein